jgi:hypothetical protein
MEKEKTLKNTKPKPAHISILVRPRNEWGLVTKPAARILKQQRPGPTFSPPTWAETSPTRHEPSIWDQRSRASLTATKPTQRGATHRNPSSFSSSPPLSPPERASEVAGAPTDRRYVFILFLPASVSTRGWARRRRAVTLRCPKSGARAGQP